MGQTSVVVERAHPLDLPAIVQILAEDELGGKGDAWTEASAAAYEAAFARMLAHADMVVLVARESSRLLGFLHLYFLQGLPGHGRLKVVLNSVFVARAARGQGVGAQLVAAAEKIAREGGATEVSLTSGKKRVDAHRFYQDLGYERRHEGFGKSLLPSAHSPSGARGNRG
jgi:GNAT superfamily N-acetyltransferase